MSPELYVLCATLGTVVTLIMCYQFIIKPRLHNVTDGNPVTEKTTLESVERIVNLDISGDTPILNIPAEFGFNEVCEVRVRKNQDGSLLIVPTLTF